MLARFDYCRNSEFRQTITATADEPLATADELIYYIIILIFILTWLPTFKSNYLVTSSGRESLLCGKVAAVVHI